jgi:osmotically-inducible protein OsmY
MVLIRQFYLLMHCLLLYGFMVNVDVKELLVGSVAANWLLSEQRSVSTVISDISITSQINHKISKDRRYAKSNIIPVSYGRNVLLIGQVSHEAIKQEIYADAMSTPQVKTVFNQLNIGTPTSLWQSMKDTWISLNIHTKLIANSQLNYHHFKIKVEDGTIFILGKTVPYQATLIGLLAQNTQGAKQVIKLIDTD